MRRSLDSISFIRDVASLRYRFASASLVRASATKLVTDGPDRGSFIVVLLDDNAIMLAISQPARS